ncbi:MAG: hypothetical protein U0R65_06425 [Candidatus Nanopelagicales bacterium]
MTALEEINAEIRRLQAAYEMPASSTPLRLAGGDDSHVMIGVVGHERFERMLTRLLDPEQFLSPYGLRSLSRLHRDHPLRVHRRQPRLPGDVRAGRVVRPDVRRELQLGAARSGCR